MSTTNNSLRNTGKFCQCQLLDVVLKYRQQDPASLSLDQAAVAGYLDILVKVEKWDEESFSDCFESALRSAHMDIVDWLSRLPEFERLKNACVIESTNWARAASCHGCLLPLLWLRDHNCPMHNCVVDNVAHDAYMLDRVLLWGLPTTNWTWNLATETGTLECLEVLAKHKVPFPHNSWAMGTARKRKQEDKLLWLLKRDAPMDSDVQADLGQSREVLREIVRRSTTMGPIMTGDEYLNELRRAKFAQWKSDLYKAAGIRVTDM